jgi:hypothetical protein
MPLSLVKVNSLHSHFGEFMTVLLSDDANESKSRDGKVVFFSLVGESVVVSFAFLCLFAVALANMFADIVLLYSQGDEAEMTDVSGRWGEKGYHG